MSDGPQIHNGDPAARRDLHAHVLGLHEALDRLEADDNLHELDYLLEGARALFRMGVTRFEQLEYNLRLYGRAIPPAPIPLAARDLELNELWRAA